MSGFFNWPRLPIIYKCGRYHMIEEPNMRLSENGFMGSWNLFLLSRSWHMLCRKLSSLCNLWSNCWNDWSRRLLLLWLPCFHSLLEYLLALSTKRNYSRKRRYTGELQWNILADLCRLSDSDIRNAKRFLWFKTQIMITKMTLNFDFDYQNYKAIVLVHSQTWPEAERKLNWFAKINSCTRYNFLIRFFVYKSF